MRRHDVYGFYDGAAFVAEYRRLFSDRQIPQAREMFIRDMHSAFVANTAGAPRARAREYRTRILYR